MKKELKSGILSADKSADCRPTVGGAYVIAVLDLNPYAIYTLIECSNRSLNFKFSSRENYQRYPFEIFTVSFQNIFNRLPLSNRGINLQIMHVRRNAVFTFYGTCIACVNNIKFQIGYFT